MRRFLDYLLCASSLLGCGPRSEIPQVGDAAVVSLRFDHRFEGACSSLRLAGARVQFFRTEGELVVELLEGALDPRDAAAAVDGLQSRLSALVTRARSSVERAEDPHVVYEEDTFVLVREDQQGLEAVTINGPGSEREEAATLFDDFERLVRRRARTPRIEGEGVALLASSLDVPAGEASETLADRLLAAGMRFETPGELHPDQDSPLRVAIRNAGWLVLARVDQADVTFPVFVADGDRHFELKRLRLGDALAR